MRIEKVHEERIIHRDIKPDNFLIGIGKKQHYVYIIDFGLAKRFRDPKTGEHIPYRDGKNLTGTARYASVNTHVGIEQSRRDDLESIVYILIYFLKGELPWQGVKAKTKSEKKEKIKNQKKFVTIGEMCFGLPPQFNELLTYVKNLKFDEIPNDRCVRNH
jgi:casein kinase 1